MKSQLPLRAENKREKIGLHFSIFVFRVAIGWTLLKSKSSKSWLILSKDLGFSGFFSKCVQLWWAVSPSSRNIFWWDRYHCKDLCLNFQTNLKRSKTGTWRQSYSRYKIINLEKSLSHPHYICFQLTVLRKVAFQIQQKTQRTHPH